MWMKRGKKGWIKWRYTDRGMSPRVARVPLAVLLQQWREEKRKRGGKREREKEQKDEEWKRVNERWRRTLGHSAHKLMFQHNTQTHKHTFLQSGVTPFSHRNYRLQTHPYLRHWHCIMPMNKLWLCTTHNSDLKTQPWGTEGALSSMYPPQWINGKLLPSHSCLSCRN